MKHCGRPLNRKQHKADKPFQKYQNPTKGGIAFATSPVTNGFWKEHMDIFLDKNSNKMTQPFRWILIFRFFQFEITSWNLKIKKKQFCDGTPIIAKKKKKKKDTCLHPWVELYDPTTNFFLYISHQYHYNVCFQYNQFQIFSTPNQ